jgi:radical SAM protein with 4Fe4S-binding SPASM domain
LARAVGRHYDRLPGLLVVQLEAPAGNAAARGEDHPLKTLALIDPETHYHGNVGPIEHTDLPECEMAIENIGWTLGNDCPYRCTHCYSMSARRKGMDLERWMIDRIVGELVSLKVKTVNLGGNEPIFTNGLDVRQSLLPYIIQRLADAGIHVGLTTSGITLLKLKQLYAEVIPLLNDIDVSLDSPYPAEHNENRGAALFGQAIKALEICEEYEIDHTVIMCAMTWNFTPAHIDAIVEIAKRHDAHIRINPLKPIEPSHLKSLPDTRMFYEGFGRLMAACEQVDLGEPLLAVATSHAGAGCPCGRTSFRIHSITPEGKVPVSPCVYVHDYKVGDLLRDEIRSIVYSPQFRTFRRRNANPHVVDGCAGCDFLEPCRGGCAARSYLHTLLKTGHRTLFARDPYCLRDYRAQANGDFPEFPQNPQLPEDKILVHRDYLCTWIGKPL